MAGELRTLHIYDLLENNNVVLHVAGVGEQQVAKIGSAVRHIEEASQAR